MILLKIYFEILKKAHSLDRSWISLICSKILTRSCGGHGCKSSTGGSSDIRVVVFSTFKCLFSTQRSVCTIFKSFLSLGCRFIEPVLRLSIDHLWMLLLILSLIGDLFLGLVIQFFLQLVMSSLVSHHRIELLIDFVNLSS